MICQKPNTPIFQVKAKIQTLEQLIQKYLRAQLYKPENKNFKTPQNPERRKQQSRLKI